MTSSLAAALTGCSFCIQSYEQDPNYAGRSQLPSEIVERFKYFRENDYDTAQTLVEQQNTMFYLRETRTFNTFDSQLNRERTITFEYYKTKLSDVPPLVMVLPILGGDYTIERSMCETLAENGVSTVLVHRPSGIFSTQVYPDLESMLISLTSDRRKTLDVITTMGEVDPERMGSFGISMGAITAVPLIATDERLKYNLLGLGGGDIPEIIMESSEDSVEDYVENSMQMHDINRQELLQRLRTNYNSDPLELAPYVDSRNVHMFLASFDCVVPTKYGLQLHESLGRPELDMLPTGHYTALLYYFWIKQLACDFFQEKFEINENAIERAKTEIIRHERLQRRQS